MRTVLIATTCALVTLGLVSCGSSQSEQAKTVTVEKAATPETVTVEKATPSTTTEDRDTSASSSSSSGSGDCPGGKIRVPDMVGEDHQLAQDTMQSEGLYNLSEEDATGQGRMLLIDRNWTVVSQSPEGGSCVTEDTTITLRSKKDDE